MGRSWVQSWTSLTLCVILSWMCVCQTEAEPHYTVAIPAILEAGVEAKCCVSLLQPNETLTMQVTLVSSEEEKVLFKQTSGSEIDSCFHFRVPSVENDAIRELMVLVQGDTFFSREARKVMIRSYKPITFVQTDKPIYLPGQKVQFRVVTMDTKFRPVNQLYSLIELEDPNSNRIGQWLNETSNGKILQLSHSLNAEAKEGTYQIVVSPGGTKVYHTFKVKKYVLPKFETKLKAPKEISIIQEEMKVEICAKYTYGQPVPGSAKIGVCRPLNNYRHYGSLDDAMSEELLPPCHEETKQTDKTGCASFQVNITFFKQLDSKVLQDSLRITALVEEEGTGVLHVDEARTSISYEIGKLSFVETPKIYDKGSNVEGQIKAVHYNNTPIADMPVYLLEGDRWSSTLIQNLTTNSDGIATFTLPTGEDKGDFTLHASSQPRTDFNTYRIPHYETAEHTVSLVQASSPDTKTVSSLEVQKREGPIPCDQDEELSVTYVIVGEPAGPATLIYMVLARGAIVKKGVVNINVGDKPVTDGDVSIHLRVTPDMAPEVQFLVYLILPSQAVIAKSADFPTEKCFKNKVSVEFPDSTALPGEKSTMKVTAEPNSLCGVSAIDQSVLIEEPGKMMDADKIFRLLPVIKTNYIPYEVEDPVRCLHVRPRRYVMPHRGDDREDAYTVFRNVGLKIVTNLVIRMPSCLMFKGREYHYGNHYGISYRYNSYPTVARMDTSLVAMRGEAGPMLAGSGGAHGGPPPPPIETVRSFFPETWIWDLVEVGDSGTTDVSVTVPDTITKWETEAFCLSSQGFGLAPRENITVFQPFFVELTMPYSIIRGEQFELKATTFNFMSDCILVSVSAIPSADYNLTPLSGNLYTSCLCGSERRTLSWTMAPVSLGKMNVTVRAEALPSQAACDNEIVAVPERGRIDVVTRTLIVKAEGTEMTKNYNWLLCPKGAPLVEEVSIELPQNVIPGSAHTSFSVLGDILGRAMKNLDGMLKMPYGCGEQNMALLAPNIYILQYLQNTQQLTPAIKEKATSFLTGGYQRQLNYKHGNGAYSTFGRGNGNTWLTAFVLRSFAKAQSFIYIDPSKIEESKTWLQNRQKANGCFEKKGKLFNNRMKGGVSDEVTLSAYITAGFLEMGIGADDPVVNMSLSCLRESMSDLTNTYTTALMAYVFTLAGDVETRHRLVQHLEKVSVDEGGFLHWSKTASETSASLSVEITSYVLLAKLSGGGPVSNEDLGYATRIVRWLTKQQNHYGGFSSTQDTVVALQALALYSTLVYSPGGASTVVVQAPSGQMSFDLNQNNKLLYQEVPLQDVSGKFSLKVEGNACASMQISVHYNIPTPTIVSTLNVRAMTAVNCTSTQRPKMSMELIAIYNGKESHTNMVILDIKLLSGFAADRESLRRLQVAPLVDRLEHKEDHILIYLKELSKDTPMIYLLDLIQEIQVDNLKPALIKIYDYYQPTDQAETEYTYICASG